MPKNDKKRQARKPAAVVRFLSFYIQIHTCFEANSELIFVHLFQFENFRVRKLKAINALNFYITLCMAFLAHISMKPETNALKVAIIRTTDPIKVKISFCYYRLAKGISGILSYAKEGVRLWFRTRRPAYRQLCLKLAV